MSQNVRESDWDESIEECWVDLVRLVAFNVEIRREEADGDMQYLARYFVSMYLNFIQSPVSPSHLVGQHTRIA